jgi:hypothetical protein
MTDFQGYSPLVYEISKETDKAIQLRCATMSGERGVWFPKSQIIRTKCVVWAKEWLIESKSREGIHIITTDRKIALSMEG